MSSSRIKVKPLLKKDVVEFANKFGFKIEKDDNSPKGKIGRPSKNYECECGEKDPINFFHTYKTICKECKSEKTRQKYHESKTKKDEESEDSEDSDCDYVYREDNSLQAKDEKIKIFIDDFYNEFYRNIREKEKELSSLTTIKIFEKITDEILKTVEISIKNTCKMLM
jgi:hypothetical protein